MTFHVWQRRAEARKQKKNSIHSSSHQRNTSRSQTQQRFYSAKPPSLRSAHRQTNKSQNKKLANAHSRPQHPSDSQSLLRIIRLSVPVRAESQNLCQEDPASHPATVHAAPAEPAETADHDHRTQSREGSTVRRAVPSTPTPEAQPRARNGPKARHNPESAETHRLDAAPALAPQQSRHLSSHSRSAADRPNSHQRRSKTARTSTRSRARQGKRGGHQIDETKQTNHPIVVCTNPDPERAAAREDPVDPHPRRTDVTAGR